MPRPRHPQIVTAPMPPCNHGAWWGPAGGVGRCLICPSSTDDALIPEKEVPRDPR